MVIKNDILNKIALQKSTFSALILIRNGYGTRKEKKYWLGSSLEISSAIFLN